MQTAYLKNKWRPEGSYFLVELDAATTSPAPKPTGEVTVLNVGESKQGWKTATGVWAGAAC